ncbi:protein phosphatase 2a regulatory subunit,putative [Trypanosoma brucei gambiense DAL972]|uniref:Protein phosphatase 2a regulatory subunit,putative n=1 Tax=Trypanosoma brucei gambiense (strain MHOM/CI/86/DAL972) TaxID=679716 RepID=C9ZXV3_TRYB9|nr:protein phosphatase 2a regulatory subunit,putative [Trypanosoma brucei gambiense DAL972]CBH14248.1 protein phosphatase 2a regulatory subunit,putative [Trypanosoma brucei gambiense DAL972]|eukprot:XP_011776518.1 protein phosphatase 2a regulatory subunit,putative [Trypanosoma brucei gambiense DAL972]
MNSGSPSPVRSAEINEAEEVERGGLLPPLHSDSSTSSRSRELSSPNPAFGVVPTVSSWTGGSPSSDSWNDMSRCSSGHSGQSQTVENRHRSANPVFSFGPRATSGGSLRSGTLPNLPKVVLHTRKDNVMREHIYCVGTPDGRRGFLANCLIHAEDMDTQAIVEEMIPGMLLVSTFSDSCCTTASVLSGLVKHLRVVKKDVFVYFIGLIVSLCCSPDLMVVRQISSSLRDIVQFVEDEVVEEILAPLVMSMNMSEWSSPKAVAASLLGALATRKNVIRASEQSVKQYFNQFVNLAGDGSTFVRQVCAESMQFWISVAGAHQVSLKEMTLSLVRKRMSRDGSDAVRYSYVAQLLPLAEKIGRSETTKHLQSLLISASSDSSWRVRYYAANCLSAFSRLCMRPSDLVGVFMSLSRDEMKEVRAAVVEQLGAFTPDIVPMQVAVRACISVSLLAKDEEPLVREAVAKQLHLLLSPLIVQMYSSDQRQQLLMLLTDTNFTVAETATRNSARVVETLLKYMQADAPINLSGSSSSIPIEHTNSAVAARSSCPKKTTKGSAAEEAAVVGADKKGMEDHATEEFIDRTAEELRAHATSVVMGLAEKLRCVSESSIWRMREAAVDALRHFCAAMPWEEFTPLLNTIRALLRDPVNVVRTRSADTLAVVAGAYGPEMAAFMMSELLDNEFDLANNLPFTSRIVAIRCLSSLVPLVDSFRSGDNRHHELRERWVSTISLLAEDDVPNVRLMLARTIAEHWNWYKSCAAKSEVICNCVERLKRDVDVDVVNAVRDLHLNFRKA